MSVPELRLRTASEVVGYVEQALGLWLWRAGGSGELDPFCDGAPVCVEAREKRCQSMVSVVLLHGRKFAEAGSHWDSPKTVIMLKYCYR